MNLEGDTNISSRSPRHLSTHSKQQWDNGKEHSKRGSGSRMRTIENDSEEKETPIGFD